MSIDWEEARRLAYEAGRAAIGPGEPVALPDADGRTLAEPLRALTDLPAFPTSSIDGWAVRGPKPWRPVGRVLAGGVAPPLTEDGTCVEIATGAMVPTGTTTILRVEDSTTRAGEHPADDPPGRRPAYRPAVDARRRERGEVGERTERCGQGQPVGLGQRHLDGRPRGTGR